MFCSKCGNSIKEKANFCPECGAQIRDDSPVSDGVLPQGIECTADGTLCWTYSQSLWTNPTILYTLLKVILISVVLVILVIAGISLADDSFDAGELVMVGIGLTVGLGLLSLIGYGVYALISGGRYNMLFVMDEKSIVHTALPKETARAGHIGDLAVIIGALGGNLTTMGIGMTSGARNTMKTSFGEVSNITQDRPHDLIKIRSGLFFNQIYASPAQYNFVLSYIVSHCPNARGE